MLLYGASGHAKVIRDCIISQGGYVESIFDDFSSQNSLDNTPVSGPYNAQLHPAMLLIIGVGDNLIRKQLAQKVSHKFGKAVHASVVISPYSESGEGTVIFQNSIVQAGSVIGRHCIINTASGVDHDCRLGDFVHISPNVTLCGGVEIGEGTHIGAGAVIIPNKKIGKWCVIGAGSVITQDIPDYSMVVGVPGKVIKTLVKEV